jgi:hypothetical protein
MMLEHAFDVCPDHNFLHRITQQVSYHAHAAGMRQFDKNGDVRTMIPECRVRRMPRAFPAENPAPRFDLGPFRIEGVTAMTQPFRAKLPRLAMAAALHKQLVMAQPGPVMG